MADRSEIREDAERALAEAWRYVRALSINGGKQPLGLFRREEFKAFEDAGLIAYRSDAIVPHLELTSVGYALAALPSPPTTASHSPHPLKADPSNTGTD